MDPTGVHRVVLGRHLGLRIVPGDGTYLVSERGSAVVDEPAAQRVLQLADGRRLDSLLAAMASDWDVARARSACDRLVAAGVLTLGDVGDDTSDVREAGFWECAGLVSADAGRRSRRPVVVRVRGDVGDAVPSMRASGLDARAASGDEGVDDAALDVVVVDDYLRPDLVRLDAEMTASGRPWLLAKPVGTRLWAGPVFGPGGACYTCLAGRLRGHRVAERVLGDVPEAGCHPTGPAFPPLTDIAASRSLGFAMTATVAVNWLGGCAGAGTSITILDSATLATTSHRPPRRPQCPACGDPSWMSRAMSAPVRLSGVAPAVHTDGGRRAVPPERMLADHDHLIDAVVGVVPALEPVDRDLPLVSVYSAGPNRAMPVRSVRGLRRGLRVGSCGKGVTDVQARASALGEALERASAVFQGDEPRVSASYLGLGEAAVHPDGCQLFSSQQLLADPDAAAGDTAYGWVPRPFDPTRVVDWTPLWSLTQGRRRYLPTAMLFYGYDRSGTDCFMADSNGAAAGTTLTDAMLQGCYELVERDAVAVWWYNRIRRPAVDLDASDPWVSAVRDAHASLNRELWALDLTFDLGIPTVVALSRRTDKATEDIVFGFGAHADRGIALRRAISELHQFLGAVAHVDADDRDYRSDDAVHLRWWRSATIRDQPHLAPDPDRPAVRPTDDLPELTDLGQEWERCRHRIEAAGLEVLAIDMTRPDIGLPVVKVVVPGLRHFWPRFAPGRLYDVPVRTGDLREPRAEAELNPVPVFV